MKKIKFIIILLAGFRMYAQAPFTTLVKEPRFIERIAVAAPKWGNMPVFKAITDTSVLMSTFLNYDTLEGRNINESNKKEIDFFKNNGLSFNLINNGVSRLSANSQVLHYKLYLANPNESNFHRVNRYNIPLLVITKLSNNYDSINAVSTLDILDYEAAPITIRLMPSLKKSFYTYNDVIYFGCYSDLRGLNLYNPAQNYYNIEFVSSSGVGVTYQGDGQAGMYNEDGEYQAGRYSVSAILQCATGKKETIQKLFDTKEHFAASAQGYFIFKVTDKSPLNIKVGYQYFFQKTITGNQSNFSVTLGI